MTKIRTANKITVNEIAGALILIVLTLDFNENKFVIFFKKLFCIYQNLIKINIILVALCFDIIYRISRIT